jgi:endonuclease G, mitochondrial
MKTSSFMSEFADRLLDILLEMIELQDYDNRTMLIRHLPPKPVKFVKRSMSMATDINNIVVSAEAWGQLVDSGEWALVIVARNALRFARGTPQGREIQSLLSSIEISTSNKDILPVKEVVVGQDERLPVSFLEKGLEVSRSVARVLVPCVFDGVHNNRFVFGTGWLIAPGLLITNHHVVSARDEIESPVKNSDLEAQVNRSVIWFDYQERDRPYVAYLFAEMLCTNPVLDYAILRLKSISNSEASIPITDWGFLSIVRNLHSLKKGDRLNIIQHPQGGPKRLAIRSNFYLDSLSTPAIPYRIRYLTDTEPGSSGSPVLDDDWRVLGLHEASVQIPEAKYKGEVIKYNNQGIFIDAIIGDLPSQVYTEIGESQKW